MAKQNSVIEHLLFDEQQLRILSEFDDYALTQLGESAERIVMGFQSLRGTELQFSEYSLRRWLALRRRLGEPKEH